MKTKGIDIARELASNNNYEIVTYRSKWNGFKVYYAENKIVDGIIPITGYPIFILVKENKAHFATNEETHKIMPISSDKDITYTEEEILKL